jgi:hypothetical protein
MNCTIKMILILGVALSLALSACGPTAPEPAPAVEEPAEGIVPPEPEPAGEPLLDVTGMVELELTITEADLQDIGKVTQTVEHPKNGPTEYTGVYLNIVLDKANAMEGANTLRMTASDGYSADVPLADVQACVDCMIAVDGQTLTMVMPGMASQAWVKDVIKLELVEG